MIYFYAYDETQLPAFEPCDYVHFLPLFRRQSIWDKKQKNDQFNSFVASLLLIHALSKASIDAFHVKVSVNEFGKIVIHTHPQWYVSITHTKGAVAVALSLEEIGIDVEKIKPISKKVIERMTHSRYSEEAFNALSDAEKTTQFTTFEAHVKYLGLSLFTDPVEVSSQIASLGVLSSTQIINDFVLSTVSKTDHPVTAISHEVLMALLHKIQLQE